MPFVINGFEQFEKHLEEMEDLLRDASAAALYAVGGNIMTDAKERAPLDQGPLRASGYVTHPEKAGKEVVVELGFGGPAAKYAVRQHEELGYSHAVGEAKYLENAITAAASTFTDDVGGLARAYAESRHTTLPAIGQPTDPNQGGAG